MASPISRSSHRSSDERHHTERRESTSHDGDNQARNAQECRHLEEGEGASQDGDDQASHTKEIQQAELQDTSQDGDIQAGNAPEDHPEVKVEIGAKVEVSFANVMHEAGPDGMVAQDVSQHGEVIFIVKDSECQETALELVIDNAKGEEEEEDAEGDFEEDLDDDEDPRGDEEVVLYAEPDDVAVQQDVVEHEEVIGLEEDDGDDDDEDDEDVDDDADDAEGVATDDDRARGLDRTCDLCGKKFGCRSWMLRHRRTHTGGKSILDKVS